MLPPCPVAISLAIVMLCAGLGLLSRLFSTAEGGKSVNGFYDKSGSGQSDRAPVAFFRVAKGFSGGGKGKAGTPSRQPQPQPHAPDAGPLEYSGA